MESWITDLFEGVMARKLNTLKNLVALMLLAWSFLVEHLGSRSRTEGVRKTR